VKSLVTVCAFKEPSGKGGHIILTNVLSVSHGPDSILDASTPEMIEIPVVLV